MGECVTAGCDAGGLAGESGRRAGDGDGDNGDRDGSVRACLCWFFFRRAMGRRGTEGETGEYVVIAVRCGAVREGLWIR